MPHYYFHFQETLFRDDKGELLADDNAALAHARRIATELADGGETKHALIVVTAGNNEQPLFKVPIVSIKRLN